MDAPVEMVAAVHRPRWKSTFCTPGDAAAPDGGWSPGRDAGAGAGLAGGVVGLWRLLVFLFALVVDESVGGVGSELGLEQANGGRHARPCRRRQRRLAGCCSASGQVAGALALRRVNVGWPPPVAEMSPGTGGGGVWRCKRRGWAVPGLRGGDGTCWPFRAWRHWQLDRCGGWRR